MIFLWRYKIQFIRNYTKKEQESYAGAGSVAEEVLSCIRTVISFNGQRQEQIRLIFRRFN